MWLEIGEPYRDNASFVEDDLLSWWKELTLIESYLKEAPFEELCGNGVRVGGATSFEHIDLIYIKLLDFTPISVPYFQSTPLSCMHFTSPCVRLKGKTLL